MRGSSSVLLREARRSARRWQTHAQRVAFSAILFAAVIGGMEAAGALVPVAYLPTVGRATFALFSALILALLGILAAVYGAQALHAEADERTAALTLLTPLRPWELFTGKIGSNLLLLLTIAAAGVPILSLLTAFGGVSPWEVTAVAAHAATLIAVIGTLSAFFALFTRSVFLSGGMAALFALLASTFGAAAAAAMSGNIHAFSYFSPLAAPFANHAGVLLVPALWAPSVLLILYFGGRLFQLTASDADLRRIYTTAVWRVKPFLLGITLLILSFFPTLAAGTVGWGLRVQGSWGTPSGWRSLALMITDWTVYSWISFAIALATWVFLHLGVDLVISLDGLFAARGPRRRSSARLRVWHNPIAWKDNRSQTLGGAYAFVVFFWATVLFIGLQSALWIIPGALALFGVINGFFTTGLAVWLMVRSVEGERSASTLELLNLTPLTPWQVLYGKSLGVLSKVVLVFLPTWPALLLGLPWLGAVSSTGSMVGNALRGFASALWFVPTGIALTAAAAWIALRASPPQQAYTAAAALWATPAALGVIALFTRNFYPLNLIFQTLVPVLTWDASAWQYLLSGFIMLSSLFLTVPMLLRELRHAR